MVSRFTIEVHSHDFPVVEFSYVDELDTIERRQTPNDITRRVTSFSNMRSINGVEESLKFSFKCAFEEIGTLVNVGDWVVLRDASGVADAWAHVADISYSISSDPGSGAVSCSASVSCESWMSLLTKSELYVPIGYGKIIDPRRTFLEQWFGSDSLNVGTMFSLDRWAQLIWPTIREIAGVPVAEHTPTVGEALSIFHKTFLRIRLPPSLGGEWLGDAVAVVHDFDTSQKYTSGTRPIDPVIGSTVGMPRQLQFDFQQTSLYEMYSSTWVPDRSLIDMYPTLETGSNVDSISAIPGTDAPSALAKVLNARPIVVYCMKPFRAEPLASSQMAYAGFDEHDVKVQLARPFSPINTLKAGRVAHGSRYGERKATPLDAAASVMDKVFKDVTWRPTVRIPKRSWHGLSLSYSDASRVNVTTIGLGVDPGNGVEATREAGLPIVNRRSVVNHGTRVKKPTWAFQLPTRETLNKPIAFWRTIAAETMQFNVNNHLMGSGSFSMINADHITDDTRTKFVRLGVGQVFELDIGRDGQSNLLGYVTSIETQGKVDSGEAVTASTTVSFSRGVAAGNSLAQFGKVPAIAVRENVTAPEDPPTTRRTAPPTSGRNQCSSGVPYRPSWPTALETIDWAKVPENRLLEWGESRGLRLSSRLTPDGRKYGVVLAASLYVVEMYWRLVYPSCVMDVAAAYRPDTAHGTSHRDGGGADWTIIADTGSATRLTVFQQWGCLGLLSTEGRIPRGGSGMYVNLTGTGVKKGLYSDRNDPTADPCNPANAGIALESDLYPRGGCGHTHYDVGGSFGLVTYKANGDVGPRPTSWIWVNTIGKNAQNQYRSNYRLGDVPMNGPGGGTEIWGAVHPKIRAYFGGGWRFDPALHGITSDVPNVMQVLGQDDSCFAANIRP